MVVDLQFIQDLKYDSHGLIPAIVQEAETGAVLMLAYMNAEAVKRTWERKETWFYSRSRQELWRKGETSGHIQQVQKIAVDCDQDALLIQVQQTGAACHEGYATCFYRAVNRAGELETVQEPVFDPQVVYQQTGPLESTKPAGPETNSNTNTAEFAGEIFSSLYRLIQDRQEKRPEGSYTTYLFNQGVDKICKKVGEESAEVIIAAKNRNRNELIAESADLLYHWLVLLAEQDVQPSEVLKELEKRR